MCGLLGTLRLTQPANTLLKMHPPISVMNASHTFQKLFYLEMESSVEPFNNTRKMAVLVGHREVVKFQDLRSSGV